MSYEIQRCRLPLWRYSLCALLQRVAHAEHMLVEEVHLPAVHTCRLLQQQRQLREVGDGRGGSMVFLVQRAQARLRQVFLQQLQDKLHLKKIIRLSIY